MSSIVGLCRLAVSLSLKVDIEDDYCYSDKSETLFTFFLVDPEPKRRRRTNGAYNTYVCDCT